MSDHSSAATLTLRWEAPARGQASPWRHAPSLLTLLFLLLLLAVYGRPFADLDFAWQVRTGGAIVRTGQVRLPDSFTYTIAGKPLPDFEWLYEVFLWAVWSVSGYGGLH